MPIRNWSTTAASNNSSPPNGWPENQTPSSVNDCARQMMADIRSQCQTAEWFDWGDTPSRASATTFKITGDVTTRYTANRRIQLNDASTLYGTITASSYSAPDTTVTVGTDSGSLTSSLTSIALAIISPTNISVPSTIGRKGADAASASTVDLSTVTGDFVDITGTTTITALGTVAAGVMRTVRFTGALTLTHNGTSLILPGAANITTANGDTTIFRSLGSGNWQCISYSKASGTPIVGVTSVATAGLATGGAITSTGTVTVTAAAQADMEAATSSTKAVTPSVMQYHPGVAKAYVTFQGTGTVTTGGSYNVTSVTDNGTGIYTVNFTTAFSNGNFTVQGTAGSASSTVGIVVNGYSAGNTTTTAQIVTINAAGTLTDFSNVTATFFGDQ